MLQSAKNLYGLSFSFLRRLSQAPEQALFFVVTRLEWVQVILRSTFVKANAPKGEGLPLKIIVTCGNRLSYLKESLPTLLNQKVSFPYSVVISVYADREGTANYLRENFSQALKTGKLVFLETPAEQFNKAKAANLAVRFGTSSQYLMFVDCDCKFSSQYALRALWDRYQASQEELVSFCYWGQLFMPEAAFFAVGGYDTGLGVDWAPDDLDLICRYIAKCKRNYKYFSGRYTFSVSMTPEGFSIQKTAAKRFPWIKHFRERTESFQFENFASTKFFQRIGGVKGSAEQQVKRTLDHLWNQSTNLGGDLV